MRLRRPQIVLLMAFTVCLLGSSTEAQTLTRDFTFERPVFAAGSPWNERADEAAVLPDSNAQILRLYRVLLGDSTDLVPKSIAMPSPWPFPMFNYDEFSMPVYRAAAGSTMILLRTYDGEYTGGANPKMVTSGDRVLVAVPAVTVCPAGPTGANSDGHMVLYEPDRGVEWDFWQASTALGADGVSLGGGIPGNSILATGAVDVFSTRGDGVNPFGYYSARASGVPLLAGLLLPEDIKRGSIDHALVFAMPGPRNLSKNPEELSPSDVLYPVATTEAIMYSTNAYSLASGQRIRMKQSLVDASGDPIVETSLAPVTRMFIQAMRTYGAYLVDNSGGFAFYAEDPHSAPFELSNDQVNALIGAAPGTPLPAGRTKWQIVLDKLNKDLESIPVSSGPWWDYGQGGRDPATAPPGTLNFEVIESAKAFSRRHPARR